MPNFEQYTTKAAEAIQQMQQDAEVRKVSVFEPVHLLYVLVTQP